MGSLDKTFNNRQESCEICGLIARNKTELDEHVKHAHKQGGFNSNEVNSQEQNIDPFIKNDK
jgi:hypothetical protein